MMFDEFLCIKEIIARIHKSNYNKYKHILAIDRFCVNMHLLLSFSFNVIYSQFFDINIFTLQIFSFHSSE